MRPHGSPDVLEARRQRVVALLEQDLSLHEIARRLGCHASSVLRWRNALQSGGLEALKAKPAAGHPARLTAKQVESPQGPLGHRS
jgi:transposase